MSIVVLALGSWPQKFQKINRVNFKKSIFIKSDLKFAI